MRTRFIGFIAAALAAIVMTSGPAAAGQKPVSSGSMITKTFTIEAIDKTLRVVTLKDPAGMLESVYLWSRGAALRRAEGRRPGHVPLPRVARHGPAPRPARRRVPPNRPA